MVMMAMAVMDREDQMKSIAKSAKWFVRIFGWREATTHSEAETR